MRQKVHSKPKPVIKNEVIGSLLSTPCSCGSNGASESASCQLISFQAKSRQLASVAAASLTASVWRCRISAAAEGNDASGGVYRGTAGRKLVSSPVSCCTKMSWQD